MSKETKNKNLIREPGVHYVTATELKNNTSEIINRMYYGNEVIGLEKHGKEIGRIVPVNTDNKYTREQVDILKKALKKYAGSMPDLDINEIKKARTLNTKDLNL
jgi:prevent-host-death family protein